MENVIEHSPSALEHPMHQTDLSSRSNLLGTNTIEHQMHGTELSCVGMGFDPSATALVASVAAVTLDHLLFPEWANELKENPFTLSATGLWARPALYLGAAYMLRILPQIVMQAITGKAD